jgi:hypothetical protein
VARRLLHWPQLKVRPSTAARQQSHLRRRLSRRLQFEFSWPMGASPPVGRRASYGLSLGGGGGHGGSIPLASSLWSSTRRSCHLTSICFGSCECSSFPFGCFAVLGKPNAFRRIDLEKLEHSVCSRSVELRDTGPRMKSPWASTFLLFSTASQHFRIVNM